MHELVEQVLATGEATFKNLITTRSHTAGTTSQRRERWFPIIDDHGTIAGIGVVVEDLTARKRAEDKLEQMVSLLRATLESAADGLLVVDRAGRIANDNRLPADARSPASCRCESLPEVCRNLQLFPSESGNLWSSG